MKVDEEQGRGTMVTEPPTAPELVNTRKTRVWLAVAAAVFAVCVVVFGVVPRVKALGRPCGGKTAISQFLP